MSRLYVVEETSRRRAYAAAVSRESPQTVCGEIRVVVRLEATPAPAAATLVAVVGSVILVAERVDTAEAADVVIRHRLEVAQQAGARRLD